jgi:CubicO group peptidase (beta-lactamase class C family)
VILVASLLLSCGKKQEQQAPAPQEPPKKQPATDTIITTHATDVAALAKPFIDGGWAGAIEIALITPDGVEYDGFGRARDDADGPPGADTVFQIGSVSKVFTSTVLAVLVETKQASLDEPVSALLPKTVKVPSDGGKEITLVELSTHTSGLPHMPTNMKLTAETLGDPYATYTSDQLYEWLGGLTLDHPPGVVYAYSNAGAGLLGHALSLRAGKPYEALVHDLVTEPLGMDATAITLAPALAARLASGRDANGDPQGPWHFDALAGAGAIDSTAGDLVRFVRANLDPASVNDATLRAAILATHEQHAPRPGGGVGLGWHIGLDDLTALRWHNGETGGYHSFVAFDEEKKLGVVVLATSAASARIDALGLALVHLLGGARHTVDLPATASVDPKVLDQYVGKYQLTPQFAITVTHDANAPTILVQATNQPQFRAWPSSPTMFYLRVIDAQVEIHAGAAGGKADAIILHQNGHDQMLKRVD